MRDPCEEGEYIVTCSGRRVSLTDPDAATIDIRDIAHHLAFINRYAGATALPYCVADHSCLVAAILRRETPRVALIGLLHDAHEAYLGDIVSPAKRALFGSPVIPTRFDGLAGALDLAIFDACGIAPPSIDEMKRVAVADEIALVTEWRDLMEHGAPCPIDGVPPARNAVKPLTWSRAEEKFLSVFHELTIAAGTRVLRRVPTGVMK